MKTDEFCIMGFEYTGKKKFKYPKYLKDEPENPSLDKKIMRSVKNETI